MLGAVVHQFGVDFIRKHDEIAPPAEVGDRLQICRSNDSASWIRRETEQKRFGTRGDDSLEIFRQKVNEENAKSGVKVTPLAFLIKAVVAALKKFPELNSSLDGDNLILKHYWHIGFAADTPQGLVVPVVRDADKKGVAQIAQEMGELSAQAREGKLKPTDMQGASFSISSLGGIGGSCFRNPYQRGGPRHERRPRSDY